MSLLHINSRSLSQQFDELKHVLDSLPFTVDFLGCSETFITNSLAVDQFEITGYQLIMAYHRGQNSTFEFDVVVLQFLPRSAIQHSYQLNEIYSAIHSYSEISQTNGAPNYPNRCIENNKLTSIKLFYISSHIYGT